MQVSLSTKVNSFEDHLRQLTLETMNYLYKNSDSQYLILWSKIPSVFTLFIDKEDYSKATGLEMFYYQQCGELIGLFKRKIPDEQFILEIIQARKPKVRIFSLNDKLGNKTDYQRCMININDISSLIPFEYRRT